RGHPRFKCDCSSDVCSSDLHTGSHSTFCETSEDKRSHHTETREATTHTHTHTHPHTTNHTPHTTLHHTHHHTHTHTHPHTHPHTALPDTHRSTCSSARTSCII